MEKIEINTIEWKAPEYNHKERSADFFWSIGVVAIVGAITAIWFSNYVFGIFILIAGGCLILFTLKKPDDIEFAINNEGIKIGKDIHVWKSMKSFDIKNYEPSSKLLVETTRYFLPIFTIPLPNSIVEEVDNSLSKILSRKELGESQSMQFMEKLGF